MEFQKKLIKSFTLCALLILLAQCTKENQATTACKNTYLQVNENTNYKAKPNHFAQSIFILNEGTFTYGNASISAYNANTKEVKNNIFRNVNGYNLGDVVQSIQAKNDSLFLVVNNSQKIEIVHQNNFERIKTLSGFSSPRYLAFKDNIALISDLYKKQINLINYATNCEIKQIETKGWTEQIFAIGNDFWTIERNGIGIKEKFAHLLQINAEFEIVNRYLIPIEPNSVLLDKNNNFWILSNGQKSKNIAPQLIYFDTQSGNINKSFTFTDSNANPNNLCYNSADEILYFSKGSKIFRMNTSSNTLPSNEWFSSSAENIYHINFDKKNKEIYLCDAKDYVSNGKIFRYNLQAQLIDEFEVGVIPSFVYFGE